MSPALSAWTRRNPTSVGLDALSDADYLELAYRLLLGRDPDPIGRRHYLEAMSGGLSRPEVAAALRDSEEFRGREFTHPFHAMHHSRAVWIRSLPPARRILDLGGVARDNPQGSLVFMGYPYEFDELVIIDLPADDRHELYVDDLRTDEFVTPQGPVRYQYHSMTDLSTFADGSVDMVCSGQTFEHVTREEGEQVLAESIRVLRPGGVLALDTPNRAVTELELRDSPAEYINPDHKVEYHHREMLDLFARHGYQGVVSYGLCYMPETAASARFVADELMRHPGLYGDPERCYMLAYLAYRP